MTTRVNLISPEATPQDARSQRFCTTPFISGQIRGHNGYSFPPPPTRFLPSIFFVANGFKLKPSRTSADVCFVGLRAQSRPRAFLRLSTDTTIIHTANLPRCRAPSGRILQTHPAAEQNPKFFGAAGWHRWSSWYSGASSTCRTPLGLLGPRERSRERSMARMEKRRCVGSCSPPTCSSGA